MKLPYRALCALPLAALWTAPAFAADAADAAQAPAEIATAAIRNAGAAGRSPGPRRTGPLGCPCEARREPRWRRTSGLRRMRGQRQDAAHPSPLARPNLCATARPLSLLESEARVALGILRLLVSRDPARDPGRTCRCGAGCRRSCHEPASNLVAGPLRLHRGGGPGRGRGRATAGCLTVTFGPGPLKTPTGHRQAGLAAFGGRFQAWQF